MSRPRHAVRYLISLDRFVDVPGGGMTNGLVAFRFSEARRLAKRYNATELERQHYHGTTRKKRRTATVWKREDQHGGWP